MLAVEMSKDGGRRVEIHDISAMSPTEFHIAMAIASRVLQMEIYSDKEKAAPPAARPPARSRRGGRRSPGKKAKPAAVKGNRAAEVAASIDRLKASGLKVEPTGKRGRWRVGEETYWESELVEIAAGLGKAKPRGG